GCAWLGRPPGPQRPAGAAAAGRGRRDGEALAGDDAVAAYEAIGRFAASPGPAVKLLRDRLRPAEAAEAKQLAALIADLDSDQSAVRARATNELRKLDLLAVGALRKGLSGGPTPEVRVRAEKLLAEAEGVLGAGEALRAVRAVEALELIGTAEAQELLRTLANGTAAGRLTREAGAALGRLGKGRQPGGR